MARVDPTGHDLSATGLTSQSPVAAPPDGPALDLPSRHSLSTEVPLTLDTTGQVTGEEPRKWRIKPYWWGIAACVAAAVGAGLTLMPHTEPENPGIDWEHIIALAGREDQISPADCVSIDAGVALENYPQFDTALGKFNYAYYQARSSHMSHQNFMPSVPAMNALHQGIHSRDNLTGYCLGTTRSAHQRYQVDVVEYAQHTDRDEINVISHQVSTTINAEGHEKILRFSPN